MSSVEPPTSPEPTRKSMSALATLAAVKSSTTDPYASRERHHNEGHGRRLTAAFEALEAFPMLAESRNRVLRLFESGDPSTADVVAAVEADVALAVTVLRLANRVDGRMRGRVESAVKGVEVLSPRNVHSIASKARTFDFFERTAVWQGVPERFRLHAVATQRAADRIARELGYEARDRLMVTSLLHDIGKLVLVHAYPGYPRQIHAEARTPEERIQSGAPRARRRPRAGRRRARPPLGPAQVGRQRDRAPPCRGRRRRGRRRPPGRHARPLHAGRVGVAFELLAVARQVGIAPTELRTVMYDLPLPSSGGRRRQIDPCPMSTREVEVLRRLAKGMVYKQIASELGLSTSTVRTHLHNVYGKLGAMDRAQAVLIATERGWI